MAEAAAKRAAPALDRTIAALHARFGNKVVTSEAVRRQHANVTTWLPNEPPDAARSLFCSPTGMTPLGSGWNL